VAVLSARSSAERESRIVSQLTEIIDSYIGTDVTIGVLVGASHAPAIHRLLQYRETESKRAATTWFKGQLRNEKQYFHPHDQMHRYQRYIPKGTIPEGIVNRAVLDHVSGAAALRGVASTYSRARRLENLSDAEISEIVVAVDGLKMAPLSRVLRKRTLTKMDAVIEERLMAAEARRANG
jgi:hypothetical protein